MRLTADELQARLFAHRAPDTPDGVDWEQERDAMERGLSRAKVYPGSAIDEVAIADGVPGSIVRAPEVATNRMVLLLHGGGFCMGSRHTHRALASWLSARSHAAVLVPDYHLAPEHPYPAGLDDAHAGWDWAVKEAGVGAEEVAIVGDSGGGGLAAALTLRLLEAGIRPACTVLFSPWVDLTMRSAEYQENADRDPVVRLRFLEQARDAYLRAGASASDPLVSPVEADWRGAAPVLIQASTDEVLAGDARLLADVLRAAGVDCTLDMRAAMAHVWQLYCGLIDEAEQSVADAGAFLRTHFDSVRDAP
ncbi:alpha/beta hydrolase fold domain-containing protein [Amycolatopsis vastitatis]|uniref:Alpha/beta hydrolase n=1 Tax=Amycolatopsis vastitatis TaxID=1905142 RepID=A0A229SQE7_9PSEU|nr:alpha/beta hydrolase [Amycolatopsis vastitatis]OXM61000.1 alpha/beta hydrolase [Amycolatopsis vastitatis]